MKNLVKASEVAKIEKKAAKKEWVKEMKNMYGPAWTKRTSSKIHKDGSRRMGTLKTTECE